MKITRQQTSVICIGISVAKIAVAMLLAAITLFDCLAKDWQSISNKSSSDRHARTATTRW